ncbi:MAG: PEP-CTERM sorting domain-containing protein [Phycisphaeraceae bacterium]
MFTTKRHHRHHVSGAVFHRGCVAVIAAVLAPLAGAPSAANADEIAVYDFGTVAAPTYNSADADANSTATAFTRAAGLGTSGDNWPNTLNGINTGDGNPAPEFAQKPTGVANSQAEALSNDSYWSFTISPNTGFHVDLDSLTFDVLVANPSFPINYYVSSSVDGFDSPIGGVVTGATGNYTVARDPIDLSGAAYQSLTETVEFRMYLWSPESGGTAGSRWGFDNVTLNGSVIPEPASLALLGAGGLLMLMRRRCRA